jgi:hypothetical protein
MCITLSIRTVSDRGICTNGVLHFIFRRHRVLCITVSNTPIADRDTYIIGVPLFNVYKLQNSVHYV